MDTIFIQGLAVDALVGVHAHERTVRQPLLVDVELGVDTAAAAHSDQLSDTIGYDAVVAAVREQVAASDALLLERLAAALCDEIVRRFRPQSVAVRVSKPQAAAALGCAAVGVIARR